MWGAVDDLGMGEAKPAGFSGKGEGRGEVMEADGIGQVKQREDHGSSYKIGEWVDETGGRWKENQELVFCF